MATKRDLTAIEARRITGARLLKRNVSQAEVARRLDVSRQTVSVWARKLDAANGAVGKLKAKAPARREAMRGIAGATAQGALHIVPSRTPESACGDTSKRAASSGQNQSFKRFAN